MINGIDYLKQMYPDRDNEDFQPSGLDLRLGQIYEMDVNFHNNFGLWKDGTKRLPHHIELPFDDYEMKRGHKGWRITPGKVYIAEVQDKIHIGESNAQFYLPRSSLLRGGVNVYTALGDLGYRGKLSFLIVNHGNRSFFLEKGVRFAQLVDFEVQGGSESYDGDYQNDKHKR